MKKAQLMKRNKNINRVKESPIRSISKAISWRIIASLTTFLISYVVFKGIGSKSDNEVLQTAGTITGVDFFAKLLFYYLHERMWINIDWGKTWRRAAWRRKYREAHQ